MACIVFGLLLIAIVSPVLGSPTALADPEPAAHPHPVPYPSFWSSGTARIPFIGPTLTKIAFRLPGAILAKIPNAPEILSWSKQQIAGMPVKYAMDAVTTICSLALQTNALTPTFTPGIDDMNFYLMTGFSNNSIPLSEPEILLRTSNFYPEKKTTIYITGWNSNIENRNDALYLLYDAYKCNGGYNFLTIDTGSFVDTLYTWSSFNTNGVGRLIGEALAKLEKHIPVENLHLIGHSLGSHIAGSAGRRFTELTGKKIPRITGLDPARPCFREGEALKRLQRGDADFVDIIHSNSGVLGIKEPIGDVDFFPNGPVPLPPGCLDIICAHHRAVHYFAETVYPGYENNFLSVKCNSIQAMKHDRCKGKKIPLGVNAPTDAVESYYLETNSNFPFGKNADAAYIPQCNKHYV